MLIVQPDAERVFFHTQIQLIARLQALAGLASCFAVGKRSREQQLLAIGDRLEPEIADRKAMDAAFR